MIDHANWCLIVPTGHCNCKPISISKKRTERWTSGFQTFTMEVDNLNQTVICSYETLAALLVKAGLVKADEQ